MPEILVVLAAFVVWVGYRYFSATSESKAVFRLAPRTAPTPSTHGGSAAVPLPAVTQATAVSSFSEPPPSMPHSPPVPPSQQSSPSPAPSHHGAAPNPMLDRMWQKTTPASAFPQETESQFPLLGTVHATHGPGPTVEQMQMASLNAAISADPASALDFQNGVSLIAVSASHRDPTVVVRALMEAAHFMQIDANQHVATHRWRVVASKLKAEKAKQVQDRLRADGLETVLVPTHDVDHVPQLGRVVLMSYTDSSLHLTVNPQHHQQIDIPWTDIEIVSVGHVMVPHKEVHYEVDHVNVDYDNPEQSARRLETATSEDHLTAYLFTPGGYASIEAKGLGYAHLGERMKSTSMQNFRTVISDILERAPQALKNEGTLHLQDGQLQQIPSYPRPQAWEEDTCGEWLVLRQKSQGTSP